MDNPGSVEVDLPQDLTAPSAARSATRRTLDRWRLGGILEPVLLVVSELVGNAVRHGRPPVEMRLRRFGTGVRIDVHDEAKGDGIVSATSATSATSASDEAESGRGLLLVEAVSDDSGVEQIEGDGKVVWATVTPPEA